MKNENEILTEEEMLAIMDKFFVMAQREGISIESFLENLAEWHAIKNIMDSEKRE